VLRDELQSNDAPEIVVHCAIDNAHPAFANPAHDPVLPCSTQSLAGPGISQSTVVSSHRPTRHTIPESESNQYTAVTSYSRAQLQLRISSPDIRAAAVPHPSSRGHAPEPQKIAAAPPTGRQIQSDLPRQVEPRPLSTPPPRRSPERTARSKNQNGRVGRQALGILNRCLPIAALQGKLRKRC
jgi:hypothetical protein